MKDPSRVQVTGALEPFAGGFRFELVRVGYVPDSAAQRMQLMAYLSRWMVEEEVPVAELTWERAQQFVEWRCAMGYRHFRSPRGLVPLLAYLRSLGVAPLPVAPSADGPVDLLVEHYQVYLLGERGLAGGTVLYYERVARLFLEQLAAAGGALSAGAVAAAGRRWPGARRLQRGRPRVGCERLFLRVNAPTGGLSPDGVSRLVHAACRRCGVPLVGAHRLRHTAATETLRAGASLEEIGQLLRQQSTFTTAIYARVDRDRLRELARPWPGGVARAPASTPGAKLGSRLVSVAKSGLPSSAARSVLRAACGDGGARRRWVAVRSGDRRSPTNVRSS